MTSYNKMNDILEPLHNECVICFELVNINKTHIKCSNCEKLYHKHCMDKWRFKKRVSCSCPSCNKNDLLLHRFIYSYKFCCLEIPREKPIKKVYEYN